MCFFDNPKAPPVTSAPIVNAPPSPMVSPSQVSAQSAQENRRKRIERTRYGLSSTIKTGGQGIAGGGADLLPTGLLGKDKLG